ncbi:MAG TPA: response regulator [Chitinophagaceae bacterium]
MKMRNVLMLENDVDDRYITDTYFINNGFDVKVDYYPSVAGSITSYLSNLDSNSLPHLILMSGRFGLEHLADLKKHDQFRQIPVVILTEMSHTFSINEAYRLGANSVIEKPSTHQMTRDKIDSFVKYWFGTVELPVTLVADQI